MGWGLPTWNGNGTNRQLPLFESIEQQLPKIQGTPAHRYLTATLPRQIQQGKWQSVDIGDGVFQYSSEHAESDEQA